MSLRRRGNNSSAFTDKLLQGLTNVIRNRFTQLMNDLKISCTGRGLPRGRVKLAQHHHSAPV
jgi:hypothetical protein